MGIDGSDIKHKRFKKDEDDKFSLWIREKYKNIFLVFSNFTESYKNILNLDKIIGYGAVFLLFLLFLTGFLFDNHDPPKQKPKPISKTPEELQFEYAHWPAMNTVLQNLKAPATADFPLGTIQTKRIGENRYFVVGLVDSQNSFGAMIRTKWVVIVDAISPCDDYTRYECWNIKEGPIFE